MAEVEKSIQISYKADLKDLQAKLKQIPNLTDQEAKKMVAALDRQLKQAEKAAKKSAEASKKAAKEASIAAVRGARDFDELEDSARRAEERLERVGDASGDIDRGFSSIGLALRGVNPQLAEAADGLADAFAVTEGLTMTMAALNPIVLASAAAVGALALGYMSYQQEVEKARQLTLDMREAQRSLNDSYKALRANFDDSLSKLGEIQDEYSVLTGQITEYELALKNTERNTKAMFQSNIDQQQTVIDKRNEELALINSMMQANLGSIENARLLSDEEKERLNNLQLLTAGVNKSIDLTKHDLSLNNELAKIRAALVNEVATQEKAMQILVGHQEQAVDLAMQIQEFENATAEAKEKQVVHTEKRVEKLEEEKDTLSDLMDSENRYFDMQTSGRLELEKLAEELFLNDEERADNKFNKELEHIEDLARKSGEAELAQQIIDEKIAKRQEDQHAEELERIEELKEKRQEAAKQNLDSLLQFGGALADLAEQRIRGQEIDVEMDRKKQEELAKMSDIERAAFQQKQKQMIRLFNFEKALSLAEIAMGTAEAVVAAQKLPVPFNTIQAALAVGTGVAQAGVVMSQQPPSFHMGGMAPDEMGAKVLRGEAILDRATVRKLGGEQGVRQLQRDQGPTNNTVVIQPFKHFGRFTREIGLKPPQQTGITGY